ncbi:hypothetical protein CMV_003826 [Castanea mollissima]|uniref:Uncharacterized protein n=1 Tax=Castanea mollissima TaxID=60419 RepID=A0A8J4RSR7_9ROSI|nr:hypothetical protein CMV_003826 [Castanea mollissima]
MEGGKVNDTSHIGSWKLVVEAFSDDYRGDCDSEGEDRFKPVRDHEVLRGKAQALASVSSSSVLVSGSVVAESDEYRNDIDLSRSRMEGVLAIWVGGSGLTCSFNSPVSVSGSGVDESDRYRTDIDLSRSSREGVLVIWVGGSGLTCTGSECWRFGYSESTGGSGLLGWSNL